MKNLCLIIIAIVLCGCTENRKLKEDTRNVQVSSSEDFIRLNEKYDYNEEEIAIFFDSLVFNRFDLLQEICYSESCLTSSESLKNMCTVYQIYIMLCNEDYDSARKLIEKLQGENFVHYQFDKFTSFYYWCMKKYEAANWNADFYFFRKNNEKNRTIKRTNSMLKFEVKFYNDLTFKFLKKKHHRK